MLALHAEYSIYGSIQELYGLDPTVPKSDSFHFFLSKTFLEETEATQNG